MLPKNRRILSSQFIQQKGGKRSSSPHLLLCVCPTKGHSKFSFSASKKIFKIAPARNLFRRRGYACVGKIINRVKDGNLYFFSAKVGVEKLSFVQLEQEIVGLLGRF